MAYGARLESVLGVKALGGSNPPFSANTMAPGSPGAIVVSATRGGSCQPRTTRSGSKTSPAA